MEQEYKNLCQVFTPPTNVKQLLDWCDYKENLFDKKIIENSCGNGKILEEVVRRYIADAKKSKKNLQQIKEGLEKNIYGIEFDSQKHKECIENLNKIVTEYHIKNVNWKNIVCQDALLHIEENKYDFVVGNPPYIKYRSLSKTDRNYIKENFTICQKGKFDYCYAFIELSIRSLKDNGRMAYLIPSSIFKNVFAEDLRTYIKPHLQEIYDYTTTKLFTKETTNTKTDRLTSSAVMVLQKNCNVPTIKYIDVTNEKRISIVKVKLNKKWIFAKQNLKQNSAKTFGDYYKVSNTIATLYNKAYVIKDYQIKDKYIITKTGEKIEKEILKDTISPKNFGKNIKEKIIFPYFYDKDGCLQSYTEKEFEAKFPYTCKYLKKFKELKKRNSDKNAYWFEYGRSQALKSSNKPKILLSTVITNKVKTKILPKDNIPYSGIYIIKKGKMSLKEANKILQSKEFYEYLELKGINASGNSYRITAKDISEYKIPEEK